MIANGNYIAKEIAVRSNDNNEYGKVRDNIERVFIDLFNFACENPELEGNEWLTYEQLHLSHYKNDYYLSKNNVEYLIQYDIVTQVLVLYELKELKEIENYEY